jgi:2-keto-4-pentenoate hydratase/2-oxohepta-3-ene-1,7-dioic acid hydratase in catechol pathway
MTANGTTTATGHSNYAAFIPKRSSVPRIGHYDLQNQTITTLSFRSGTLLHSLYEVIEVGDDQVALTDEVYQASDITLLPPISGRDVLAVGKNYVDHAKEFNASG